MPTLYNGGGMYQGIQMVITVTSTAAMPTTRGAATKKKTTKCYSAIAILNKITLVGGRAGAKQ